MRTIPTVCLAWLYPIPVFSGTHWQRIKSVWWPSLITSYIFWGLPVVLDLLHLAPGRRPPSPEDYGNSIAPLGQPELLLTQTQSGNASLVLLLYIRFIERNAHSRWQEDTLGLLMRTPCRQVQSRWARFRAIFLTNFKEEICCALRYS